MGFFNRRRMIQTTVIVTVLIVAIYFFLPQIAGLENALDKLGDADALWVGVAVAFELVAFATYVALFRGVVGGDVLPLTWREAYEINMAGLAATRLFSAGGAGGIALTYWALRKAGMERATVGLPDGRLPRPPVHLVPAGADRLRDPAADRGAARGGRGRGDDHPGRDRGGRDRDRDPDRADPRRLRAAHRQLRAGAPPHRPGAGVWRRCRRPSSSGVRIAFDLVGHPSRGGLAVAGAVGFWAANIAILWASFKAFGVTVPFAVIVQGFFLGMLANLFPFAPAGVGAVDAGMIGAFLLFGLPEAEVFAAVLTYRVIAFWLPIPPGIVAFFQLRHTVSRWEAEGRPAETAEEPLPEPARS